jgi:hypothetical protein
MTIAKRKTTKKATSKAKATLKRKQKVSEASINPQEPIINEKIKELVKEAVKEVKKEPKKPKSKIGIDEELDDEETGEEVEQRGHPELIIDNEHRPAFNYITELIDRREHTTEDGRTIILTTKFCVSDRALGKTINGNIKLLYKVSIDDQYNAALLSRNWNENASQVRPYYEDLLRFFI